MAVEMSKEKLLDRARDELFSHVHRCGVLHAEEEDQLHWMNETIEYIGERYPDLTDGDLRDLHQIGIRFCKPAIAHGSANANRRTDDAPIEELAEEVMAEEVMEDASVA